jgi:hypothetical protein
MDKPVTVTEIKKVYAKQEETLRQIQENYLCDIAPYLISRIYSELDLYGEVNEQKIVEDFTQKNSPYPKIQAKE